MAIVVGPLQKVLFFGYPKGWIYRLGGPKGSLGFLRVLGVTRGFKGLKGVQGLHGF